MKFIKRLGVFLLACTMLLSTSPTVFATEYKAGNNDALKVLIENGYSENFVNSLPKTERDKITNAIMANPQDVQIVTVVMQVDNLAEIEAFCAFTDAELIEMGADEAAVKAVRKDIERLFSMSDSEVAQELGISKIEAQMIQRAIKSGKESSGSDAPYERKRGVSASGTITQSEMTYYQTVINNSTSTGPNYDVILFYNWAAPYYIDIFQDALAVAWGGGLTPKNISGNASYYQRGTYDFTTYHTSYTFSPDIVPQTGVKFYMPQSIGLGKNKMGQAGFGLYQTRWQGYDTNIVSRFAHKVISFGGAEISISSSGPSVGLVIGTAYDQTPQASSIISY